MQHLLKYENILANPVKSCITNIKKKLSSLRSIQNINYQMLGSKENKSINSNAEISCKGIQYLSINKS